MGLFNRTLFPWSHSDWGQGALVIMLRSWAGIQAYDIVSTLQYLGMIKYWRGKHVILRKEDVIADYMERIRHRPRDKVQLLDFFHTNCLGNLRQSLEVEALWADGKGEAASGSNQEEAGRASEGQINTDPYELLNALKPQCGRCYPNLKANRCQSPVPEHYPCELLLL